MKLTPTQLDALVAGGLHEHQDVHASWRTLIALYRRGLVRFPEAPYRGSPRGWARLTDEGKEVILVHARKAATKLRAKEDAAAALPRP